MMNKKKVLLVFGTRPEAIKMAPIAYALMTDRNIDCKICVTGQHKEMLNQVLDLFQIQPDYDLAIMKEDQDIFSITTDILNALKDVLALEKPDLVLVHGDTATTLSTTLACYFMKINVGHVEAGLRTGNIYSPWPEEGNRKLVGAISNIHFAATEAAKNNLINENVDSNAIFVTGNTVIDALLHISKKLENSEIKDKYEKMFSSFNFKKFILVTGHRRENLDNGFKNICLAILELSQKYPEINIVYPVHMNPRVKSFTDQYLKNVRNIFLIEPQEYVPFIYLMKKSYFILTDSGGIQEEAPALGKPVLLMRDTTERPEAVQAGTVKLVGTDIQKIVDSSSKLIENKEFYNLMSSSSNPYGDGKASQNILSSLNRYFSSTK